MNQVFGLVFFLLRVLALTFVVGLVFPAFDNIILAPGVTNALLVAGGFSVMGWALGKVRNLITKSVGGGLGVLFLLVSIFLLPAFALMGVAGILPEVLTVKTFGAAFGAGLITLVFDFFFALVVGVLFAATFGRKAVEAARKQQQLDKDKQLDADKQSGADKKDNDQSGGDTK